MMLILIATLAIAVSVFSIPIDPCGENMAFNECGTSCPAKCGVEAPDACNMMCVRGCFCKSGFILAQDGETCIANTDCHPSSNSRSKRTDQLCELNEEFKKCGLNAEPSCSNPNPMHISLRCLKQNVCQCRDGFFRDANNACVSSLQCIQSAAAS